MLPFTREERIYRVASSKPQAPQPQAGAEQTVPGQTVLNQTVQVSSIRETINLLEADLGAMIGDVQRASELVRRKAEYSAATSNRITLKTDGLVAQAGSASRDDAGNRRTDPRVR